VVGKTLQGNNIDLISITKKVSDPVELANRMVMIFTSRIRPGETNSSWMMHGLLEFLLGGSHYIVKIIPMLNPDGVIVGNYRCNIKGYDLNRKWSVAESLKDDVIEIWHVVQMIQQVRQTGDLAFFCDFHGI
jgi:cytosolic carboxypeptidase protein 2/3